MLLPEDVVDEKMEGFTEEPGLGARACEDEEEQESVGVAAGDDGEAAEAFGVGVDEAEAELLEEETESFAIVEARSLEWVRSDSKDLIDKTNARFRPRKKFLPESANAKSGVDPRSFAGMRDSFCIIGPTPTPIAESTACQSSPSVKPFIRQTEALFLVPESAECGMAQQS